MTTDMTHRERPSRKKYDGYVRTTIPRDLEDQMFERARREGTSVSSLVRGLLYREFEYVEKGT